MSLVMEGNITFVEIHNKRLRVLDIPNNETHYIYGEVKNHFFHMVSLTFFDVIRLN